ncbi:MAG: signal peptidase I [Desertimonas sp.]
MSSESEWDRRLRALDERLDTLGVGAEQVVAAGAGLVTDGTERSGDASGDVSGGVSGEGIDPAAAAADDHVDDRDQPVATNGPSRGRAILDWVIVIGVALLVAMVVRTYVLAHFVVDGVSMSTTLHDGDRVFVNKLSYRLHDPHRGDVVVLHELEGSGTERDLIKRVIALPGETIAVTNCQVTIDGRSLDEPYLDPPAVTPGTCGGDVEALTVPSGHVFVMGDNRGASMDSRDPSVGPVDEDDLVGRAFVVFWPRANWQWL